jgi:putative ABC transport system substrate-binding protein
VLFAFSNRHITPRSRRDLLGAVAWAVVARAQQPDRVRRIGVLMTHPDNDPEGKHRLSAFTQGLAELGWTEGRNVRMDVRWSGGDINRMQLLAKELVGLQTAAALREAQHVEKQHLRFQ